VTELEILRRRRELVLLSAELQRETLVRRLDNVARHPAQLVLGFVTSAASLPLLFKLGSMVVGRIARKRRPQKAARGAKSLASRALQFVKFFPALKFLPVHRFLPVLKSFNR
jgi:hypothetical protein